MIRQTFGDLGLLPFYSCQPNRMATIMLQTCRALGVGTCINFLRVIKLDEI